MTTNGSYFPGIEWGLAVNVITSVLKDEGVLTGEDAFQIDGELPKYTEWLEGRGEKPATVGSLTDSVRNWARHHRDMPNRVGPTTIHVKVVRNYGPVTVEYGESQSWEIRSSAEYWKAVERMTDTLWGMHAIWLRDKAPRLDIAPQKGGATTQQEQPKVEEILDAASIEHGFTDGKHTFKVRAGNYTKFGINIYPEAVKSAGLDPDTIPLGYTTLEGWKAQVAYNEKGTPYKVLRLFRDG